MKKNWPNLQMLYINSHAMSVQQYMEIKKYCERCGITFRLECVDAWGEVLQCLINSRLLYHALMRIQFLAFLIYKSIFGLNNLFKTNWLLFRKCVRSI